MNLLESVSVPCPYCGQTMDLEIDCAAGNQQYTEDCPVCCKPVTIVVAIASNGTPSVEARPEDS
ncbi:CPXCG motif-containing cysteine-rich protein [Pelodictyon luteolum]|uniref:CPXCG motif-containing cysteine-rich protein n=1 Tax=Chlorobium luteolum (strain DSM 273 / BCRC 81028 / 2530) TaxID=319225 RepID=Q3B370_CHLL3|nr:CPXCG motif-containing cysteine-rich protein [Pelodictyon luteolum]ABB24211.1 conserved hypothetical protein [Pelodictyon luteolum DSM 273]